MSLNDQTSNFTVDSNNQLRAIVPSGATTGPISVTNAAGTVTSVDDFTVTSGPGIASFTPTSGTVGTQVTITGASFTGATGVGFNGVSASSFAVDSDTQIRANVPTGATTGPISVIRDAGAVTSSEVFVVLAPPTIASFTPTSGSVGTEVTVAGSDFTDVTSVSFNGVASSFSIDSDSQLRATVPSGATTGAISLVSPHGTGVSGSDFTVTVPSTPSITSFSPTSGIVGDEVTIVGENFTGVTSVSFNGTSAEFTIDSELQLRAVVPNQSTTGPIHITNSDGRGTSASEFSVLELPTIVSFSPASGPAGTEVTITGSNFTDLLGVSFDGVAATLFTADSDTGVRANVPSGASSGRITVTTAVGAATSPNDFTVEQSLTSFSFVVTDDAYTRSSRPNQNNGHDHDLKVKFGSSAVRYTYLKFNVNGLAGSIRSAKIRLFVQKTGGSAVSIYQVSNNYDGTTTPWDELGLVWANQPDISGAPLFTLSAANPDVEVEFDVTPAITGNGSFSFALTNDVGDLVEYSAKDRSTDGSDPLLTIVTEGAPVSQQPPDIASFDPESGPVGTQVTLTGNHFTGVSLVTFNGEASSFNVVSDSELIATVPDDATSGQIRVTNVNGTSISSTDFTVTPTVSTDVTFNPTEDSFVWSAQPDNDYGSAQELRVREPSSEDVNAYLKFSVTGLSDPVESAVVRLEVLNDSDDGGGIYSVSNNYEGTSEPWDEDGLRWPNAPAISSIPLSSVSAVSVGDVVEFDVTAAISGDGVYSFAISNNSRDVCKYHSKEGLVSPELVVSTGSGSSSTSKVSPEPSSVSENEQEERSSQESGDTLPETLSLLNYPNPFNIETTIEYALPAKARVRLLIYNLRGQKIRELVDAIQQPGTKKAFWNGKNDSEIEVASGVYFVRINVGSKVISRKITLQR